MHLAYVFSVTVVKRNLGTLGSHTDIQNALRRLGVVWLHCVGGWGTNWPMRYPSTLKNHRKHHTTHCSGKRVSVFFKSPPIYGVIICKGCSPCMRRGYVLIPKDWVNGTDAQAKPPALFTSWKDSASKSTPWCPEFLVNVAVKKLKFQHLSQLYYEHF